MLILFVDFFSVFQVSRIAANCSCLIFNINPILGFFITFMYVFLSHFVVEKRLKYCGWVKKVKNNKHLSCWERRWMKYKYILVSSTLILLCLVKICCVKFFRLCVICVCFLNVISRKYFVMLSTDFWQVIITSEYIFL